MVDPRDVRMQAVPVAFWVNPQTGKVTVDVADLIFYVKALLNPPPEDKGAEAILEMLLRWLQREQSQALTNVAAQRAVDSEFGA
jgi:hypothetical protein